jgi:hypothetical protein
MECAALLQQVSRVAVRQLHSYSCDVFFVPVAENDNRASKLLSNMAPESCIYRGASNTNDTSE